MAREPARRFYSEASVSASEEGCGVNLDDRPVNTPGGCRLILPTEALARAVAGEWQAQGEKISPRTMPLMGLSSTALDRVGPRRSEVVAQTAKYACSDLLCYRADSPPELVARQAERWQPLIDWAGETHHVKFMVTVGISPVSQLEPTLRALRKVADALDDFELTALATITEATGSMILGLALLAGRIDADQVFDLSRLDETFQAETWGDDHDAVSRAEAIREDIRSAAAFLSFARRQE